MTFAGKPPSLASWTTRVTAGVGVLIGAGWVLAWLFNLVPRLSAAGSILMKVNAALGVCLGGASLLLLWPKGVSMRRRSAGVVLATLVLLIGGLTFSEHLLHYNLGIDQLIASEPRGAAATISPNRMGPIESASIALLGSGLLILAIHLRRFVSYLGLAIFAINLVPAVGYIFGAVDLYGLAHSTAISWSSALALLSLGIGLVAVHYDGGLMLQLLRNDAGGMLVRRLLPAALIVPIAMGQLRVMGERAGMYRTPTDAALLIVGRTLFLSAVLWQCGWWFSRSAARQDEVERKLRNSEEQLRTLADSIPQLVWVADGAGRVIWYNQRWYEYTGTTPQQMEGSGWQSVHDPEMLSQVSQNWKASIASGKPFQTVIPLRGADGVFRPFLTGVMPVRDGHEKIVRWFGTNTNISEQKHVEAELRKTNARLDLAVAERKQAEKDLLSSQQRLAAIVGTAMDAVITLNAHQRIVVFNAAAERIFECPASEALNMSLDRFIPEQMRQAFLVNNAHFSDIATSRSVYSTQTLYGCRSSGQQFPLEAAISQVTVDGETLYTLIVRDITMRKHAEEALRENEERFRSMYEHAAVGLEQVSADDRSLMVNPALCRMLGYMETGLLGKTFREITYPEDRAREEELLKLVLSGERDFYEMEKRYLHSDGSVVWANLTSSAVKDIAGHLLYRISIIQDVTQRKKAEAQLQQALKMEAIGRLAGGVAHDFNTLLNVILGYSELSLVDLPENDPNRVRVEQIQKSAQIGAVLTKQLLAFSRKQSVSPQIFDLEETVVGMESMIRRLLPEDIEIVVNRTQEICPVKADPSQLQQVLLNLAINAGQAMPRGGKLTIEVGTIDLNNQELDQRLSLAPGRYEALSVSDTGRGIDADILAHIFDPFFTTKPAGQGTGLGLATVYGIVKDSGGDILVNSQPGSGSTFKVFLPRSTDVAVANTPLDSVIKKTTGTETILLVEDSAPLRELTREVLSRRGYTVLEAADGVFALELSRSYSDMIHLVISDIVMPRMRGTELANYLIKERPDAALLFMSGYAEDEKGQSPTRVRMLQKPCSSEALLQTVRQVLDEIQSRSLREAS